MSSITDPVDDAIASALCTQCGLCCTGALHNFAVLGSDEIDHARALGLRLRTDGKPGFALPCSKLRGSCCSIYDQRPRVCGKFKCALLIGMEAGSIGFDDASNTVAGARRLFEHVHSLLPDGTTIPMARSLIEAPPSAEVDSDDRSPQLRLKLAITALSLFLDRHFRKTDEGTLLTLEAVVDAPPTENS